MKTITKFIYAVCAALALPCFALLSTARADTIALSFSGGSSVGSYDATLGWGFSLSAPVVVTGLGVWDYQDDGLMQSHDVTIWTSTGAQLVQATVPAGTGATLTDGFRYVSVTPMLLPAGDYTIAAYYPPIVPRVNDNFAASVASVMTASGLTYDGGRAITGNAFPPNDVNNGGFGTAYFGANFRFTLSCTPDTWESKAPMLQNVSAGSSAVAGGKLYIFEDSNQVYDPGTDSWSFKMADPIYHRALGAAGTIDGKIYLAEGWENHDANAATRALRIYDPATDLWADGADSLVARGNSAHAVIGSKLYIASGRACYCAPLLDQLEIYDSVTNMWSFGAPIPLAVEGARGASFNGKFYVVGGTYQPGNTTLGAVQIYDPATDTWTNGASMSTPRGGMAAGVVNGKLYVVDGGNNDGPVSTLEIYDPNSDIWTTAASTPPPGLYTGGGIDSTLYAIDSSGNLEALSCSTPTPTPTPEPTPTPTPEPTPTPTPTPTTTPTPTPTATPTPTPAYAAQVQPPINADGTSVFNVRRGVVPVKFTLTQGGVATCDLPPATIAVTRTAGGMLGEVNESAYSGSADSGSNFRIDGCQYIYNLSASALGIGTYRADIKINGQVVGSGVFQLK